MNRVLITALLATLPALGWADTSTKPPKETLAATVFDHMLPVIADSSEQDPKSPVRGAVTVWHNNVSTTESAGIRNFQGSNTAVRGALSYGIVRAAGSDLVPGSSVPPSEAHRGWAIANTYAFIDPPNQEKLEKAFHTLFGRALVKRRTGAFVEYDRASLETAFAALYVKPGATLGGTQASVVYETLFKAYVASKAETVAAALAKKGWLAAKAKDYLAKVKDAKFDATEWQYGIVKELGDAQAGEARLVGTLVRRQADGTLPAIVKMLRTVLADYDAPTLKRLDSKLRSPGA
jgi:hypothetical protein